MLQLVVVTTLDIKVPMLFPNSKICSQKYKFHFCLTGNRASSKQASVVADEPTVHKMGSVESQSGRIIYFIIPHEAHTSVKVSSSHR